MLVLCSSLANAANAELFAFLPADQLKDVPPALSQRITQIKRRPTTASVTLLRVNTNVLKGDGVRLSLPDAKILDFSKGIIESKGANDFTWYAALSGTSSSATIVVLDGNTNGTIRENGNLYRIEPVGNGVHALIKVNQSRFPPDHPPSFKDKEKRGGASRGGAKQDIPKAAAAIGIDVLVAYTSAARAAVTDIAGKIQLAIAEANQSYQNSGINIKLTMVDTFEIPYVESGKTFDKILADFSAMPDVNNRRDKSRADMAALIIDQPDYCGMANAIMANASNAFAVVYYDCATGYYSFAHELGHLQGARHDPANDPTTPPFTYGHGLQHVAPAPTWRTIMAYNCSGNCPRLQFWSNPNIKHNGIPTGDPGCCNNARVLNETANTVAGFR